VRARDGEREGLWIELRGARARGGDLPRLTGVLSASGERLGHGTPPVLCPERGADYLAGAAFGSRGAVRTFFAG